MTGRLPHDECLRRLAQVRIGRLGFHARALPVVVPVPFALDGESVVVKIRAGSQLESAVRNAVVAFEVDEVDLAAGRAWSVSATGTAAEITDAGERAQAEALDLDDWSDGGEHYFVRISLDLVSGREAVLAPRHQPAGDGEPGFTGPAAVAETHVGLVFFAADRAYKLKKPVDFGFVDFRTREARLAACRREVALNRRIAPDVYLGVADLTGPDGRLCDHLVVMRRMPPERRLSRLVAEGRSVGGHLARLARLLAEFHADCATSPEVETAASVDAQARRWEANAEEMEQFVGPILGPATVAEIATLAAEYLTGRRPLFACRIADGKARDGHGDLLADDIFCLDDGPRVLDCLEFDDHLRYGDVLADVAFLAMDLDRLGRPDLAGEVLDEYRTASNDSWPRSLAHHYIAYRAQVRAKVACLRWEQGDAESEEAARLHLALCCDHLRRGRIRLVVVGGLPGTGKSTVALGVGGELGATVIRSDEVRKELAGVDVLADRSAPVDRDLYTPERTAATYEEILARSRRLLSMGESVVLDATWADPAHRADAARVAREASASLVELACVAPVETAAARINRRARRGGDPSDATPEVLEAMAARAVPWPSARSLDTSGQPDDAVRAAVALIEVG